MIETHTFVAINFPDSAQQFHAVGRGLSFEGFHADQRSFGREAAKFAFQHAAPARSLKVGLGFFQIFVDLIAVSVVAQQDVASPGVEIELLGVFALLVVGGQNLVDEGLHVAELFLRFRFAKGLVRPVQYVFGDFSQ